MEMKAELLNIKGKAEDKGLTLNEAVWGVELNPDLVAQALYVYQNNQRMGTAHAKTRGDVRGGGRKPWAQKGTGRARAGSSRSPLWKGGGVTFVPNNRNWKKKLNKKMSRKAISMVLSEKFAKEQVTFYAIDSKAKSSELRALVEGKKVTFVTDIPEVYQALRNVERVNVVRGDDLGVYDVINSGEVMMTQEVVAKIEERLNRAK